MIREEQNGLLYYSYELFAPFSPVANIVSTRLGGVSTGYLSSLNLSFSPTVGDDQEAVVENRSRLYTVIGTRPEQVAQAELVHGTHVETITEQTPRGTFVKLPKTDGLVSNVPGIALFIPVADCAALSFYDPKAHVIGMIHAGWKGAVAGVIAETIQKMQVLGSDPTSILVGVSPVLEKCCYQVMGDLVETVTKAFPSQAHRFFEPQGDDQHFLFDFLGMLRWQLQEGGILPEHIEDSGMCTACNVHEFYSYRAEGGRTGRFAGLIMMKG
jgi:purine-nucleoside/S-methyl-5'-thioadenosine phosphorylase / adenosine deaminase